MPNSWAISLYVFRDFRYPSFRALPKHLLEQRNPREPLFDRLFISDSLSSFLVEQQAQVKVYIFTGLGLCILYFLLGLIPYLLRHLCTALSLTPNISPTL